MESGKKFLGEEILIIKKDKGKIHPCQYKSTVCGNLAGTPGPVPDSCADPVSWGAPHTRFQVPSGFPEDIYGRQKEEGNPVRNAAGADDRPGDGEDLKYGGKETDECVFICPVGDLQQADPGQRK